MGRAPRLPSDSRRFWPGSAGEGGLRRDGLGRGLGLCFGEGVGHRDVGLRFTGLQFEAGRVTVHVLDGLTRERGRVRAAILGLADDTVAVGRVEAVGGLHAARRVEGQVRHEHFAALDPHHEGRAWGAFLGDLSMILDAAAKGSAAQAAPLEVRDALVDMAESCSWLSAAIAQANDVSPEVSGSGCRLVPQALAEFVPYGQAFINALEDHVSSWWRRKRKELDLPSPTERQARPTAADRAAADAIEKAIDHGTG